MIEFDLTAPILLRVAVVASGVEILAVRAGCAMAAVAVCTQLLRGRIRGMTHVAIEFGVYPDQRKFCLRQVIILDGLPNLVVVAIGTLGAQASRVGIVGLVAAVAILRNLVLVDAAAVTAKAIYLRVSTEQGETAFLFMIELCRLPFAGRVTLAAIGATLTAMGVVR